MTDANPSQPSRPLLNRKVRFWALGCVGLVLLGLALDRWSERRGVPAALAGAHRIWLDQPAPKDVDDVSPVAFWAIKDFDLTREQRATGGQTARLLVLGDPSALVYWNGVLIHSSQYRLGQQVTQIKVGALLEPRNRVVIEARSDIGVGGVMAALWLDLPASDGAAREPEAVWRTDASWQTTRRFDSAILAGLLPLSLISDLAPVKAWPRLDLGRWRPLKISEVSVEPSWPSRRLEKHQPVTRTVRTGQPFVEGEPEPWPDGVLLTFERTVEGCLGLAGPDLFARRMFFLEAASVLDTMRGPEELARAHGQVWTHRSERVVPLASATAWMDTTERSFKVLFLEGAVQLEGAGATDGSTVWVQPCAGAPTAAPERRLLARASQDDAFQK